jgi:hypothetical protein
MYETSKKECPLQYGGFWTHSIDTKTITSIGFFPDFGELFQHDL